MLNVVVASDDNYAKLLVISLTSLLENNKKSFDLINIYILDDKIKENNKKIIYNLTKSYPCQINFIKTKNLESFNIKFQTMERNLIGIESLTPYARLFMHSLLPNDLKKVLYLDCDSLTLGTYDTLWKMDIDDYYCAAVIDPGINENKKIKMGYDKKDLYINSGFLLVNLEKWRKDNVEKKFIEFLSKHQNESIYYDQGVINGVFKGKIKIIEPKYNLQFHFQYYDYKTAKRLLGIKDEYYTKEIVDYCKQNPIFVHFCGGEFDRPWHNQEHKYNKTFVKYAKLSNCENVLHYLKLDWKKKIVYKGYNNPLIKFLLKSYMLFFNND